MSNSSVHLLCKSAPPSSGAPPDGGVCSATPACPPRRRSRPSAAQAHLLSQARCSAHWPLLAGARAAATPRTASTNPNTPRAPISPTCRPRQLAASREGKRGRTRLQQAARDGDPQQEPRPGHACWNADGPPALAAPSWRPRAAPHPRVFTWEEETRGQSAVTCRASAKKMSKVRCQLHNQKNKTKWSHPANLTRRWENGVWGLRGGLGRGERMAGGPSR